MVSTCEKSERADIAEYTHTHTLRFKRRRQINTHLEDAVLLAERVKQRVHGVEHGDHLHGSDVAADAGESDDVAEQDGHVWENLGGKT